MALIPLLRSVAFVHRSIFTTVELTLKQPVDFKTAIRLVSISPDGVVTVRLADCESFRNGKDRHVTPEQMDQIELGKRQ